MEGDPSAASPVCTRRLRLDLPLIITFRVGHPKIQRGDTSAAAAKIFSCLSFLAPTRDRRRRERIPRTKDYASPSTRRRAQPITPPFQPPGWSVGDGWDRREGGAMEPLEAAIAIVFNALLLVFMVKLFFAMFQMKLVVILFYLVVVLFALAFSGRGPAGF
ncbi:uncharacterized protein LOC119286956 isoform X2 [Triticum dicoccoides]|nr:uncharacterized protein LOC119286956 isoform X2 [Triticum dicoccoides]